MFFVELFKPWTSRSGIVLCLLCLSLTTTAAEPGDVEIPQIIPHLTRLDGTFTTVLRLANTTEEAQTYSMTFYAEDGSVLGTADGALDSRAQVDFNGAELLDGQPVSHVQLAENNGIRAVAIYKALGEDRGPAQVWSTTRCNSQWLISLGDDKLTFDGLAVVNMGDASTGITVTFYDETGALLQTQTLTEELAARAKGLFNLSALTIPDGAASLRVSANQFLVVTALRGDFDSTFLWQNQAIGVDP
ncbi:MAG: hypothetical protein QNK37_37630 [Acidobacteriota bacterium]|nr:hypothetical protein [Acidobacteriota bacterium]